MTDFDARLTLCRLAYSAGYRGDVGPYVSRYAEDDPQLRAAYNLGRLHREWGLSLE